MNANIMKTQSMTSEVINFKISKLYFSAIYFLFNAQYFLNYISQHYEDAIFFIKGHQRSYEYTFMLKSLYHICLGPTNYDENLYEEIFFHKCHFYVIEKFCDFLF